jgi:hypothetical protein
MVLSPLYFLCLQQWQFLSAILWYDQVVIHALFVFQQINSLYEKTIANRRHVFHWNKIK